MCSELRPALLDDLGLIAAMEWQAREFEKNTGIIVE
jgi:signal transduction histidine kinase